MNKAPFIIIPAFLLSVGMFFAGENNATSYFKAQASAQIDDCARKANVYPDSCKLVAVVVKPALLPPPVEGK